MIIKNKKSQVAELDLFISILIFGIIVIAIMFAWNNYNTKIDAQINKNTKVLTVFHITDLLVKYPGKPTGWEKFDLLGQDYVEIIGLAKDDRVIDPIKLSKFLSMNYTLIKDKLSINEYDFYFALKNINGSDFSPEFSIGNVTTNSSTITIRRYIIYNETEAIIEFKLQG